ncbi:MAG: RNA 2',3'-cyclic phosphodiesterase, partial [Opitutales bacterium]
MAAVRLFTALLPPPVVRDGLAELAAPLPGVRWTAPDHLHLTLRFIGECDGDRPEQLAAALGGVRVEPFILPVTGLGLFPSRGPARVLWVGVGQGHPRLFQLRKQVDEALLSVDPGLDVHSFHPHFTLGRLGPDCESRPLAKFLERHAAFEAPPFRVDAIHL